jgi:hypothetical protein
MITAFLLLSSGEGFCTPSTSRSCSERLLRDVSESFSLKSLPSSSFENIEQDSSHSAATGNLDYIDVEAMNRKNLARKKFGLAPLSEQEYLAIESQINTMKLDSQAQTANINPPKPQVKSVRKGIFSGILGEVFQSTCESNFDCQRPEVCCDYGFKKTCCRSGTPVGFDSMQAVRIPITKDDGYYNGV